MTRPTYSSLPQVEQAIQESLHRRQPALLVTTCPETHQALYAALAGACGDIGTTARDGTARFSGHDDDGERWDVRLRLELPKARAASTGALWKMAEGADEELRMAIAGYVREKDTQAATAVGLAIVNCEQARADAVDAGEK